MPTDRPEDAMTRVRESYATPDEFRQLWRKEPVREVTTADGRRAWQVTGMAEVRTVLSDPRFSRAETRRLAVSTAASVIFEAPGNILDLDPPEHTRLRRLVASTFTARRIRDMRPRIQEIADNLIADMKTATAPIDLNPVFCLPLPIAVICEILGVPFGDREEFRGYAERVFSAGAFSRDESLRSLKSLAAYMTKLIADKQANPDGSLLESLTTARYEEDRLSEQELVHLSMSLLIAGHETTANMIGMGLVALFDHPLQLAALRDDPSLAPTAVDEVLRHIPLAINQDNGLVRATTEDVELAGVTIPAHSAVYACQPAANMDPQAFDDPERFDITRTDAADHMSFGHGPHHCLGAMLARIELEVAFNSLLAAFPTLALAVPIEELAYQKGMIVTGLQSVPVTW
ncbi:MAG TPA: cytochrome P450 [Streptosporangiaceae bacterium]|nr:cytochrome P450 [Streptosporangiaceae bacterium]